MRARDRGWRLDRSRTYPRGADGSTLNFAHCFFLSNAGVLVKLTESRSQDGDLNAALPGEAWETRLPLLKRLFERIEPRYDRLNRRLSLGLDRGWRNWAARALGDAPGPWLDLASGTGDMALALVSARRRLGAREAAGSAAGERPRAPVIVRMDLSPLLLRAGAAKLLEDSSARNSSSEAAEPKLLTPGAAAEMDHLPVRDQTLGAIAQGFALRHCRDLDGFFAELFRALRPGGAIAIIDMRYPRHGFGGLVYRIYFTRVLPRIAALFGGDRDAYEFMVDSVKALPEERALLAKLKAAGFIDVASKPGFLGSVALLSARRPS